MKKSKENDGWFGPEVKPKSGQFIKLFWGSDFLFNIGCFAENYVHGIDAVEMVGYHPTDWESVACWQPIKIEEIPERFKIQPLATKKESDKNEV